MSVRVETPIQRGAVGAWQRSGLCSQGRRRGLPEGYRWSRYAGIARAELTPAAGYLHGIHVEFVDFAGPNDCWHGISSSEWLDRRRAEAPRGSAQPANPYS